MRLHVWKKKLMPGAYVAATRLARKRADFLSPMRPPSRANAGDAPLLKEMGLVPPPARTDSGYRLYDESTLERLALITRAEQLLCRLDDWRPADGMGWRPVRSGAGAAVELGEGVKRVPCLRVRFERNGDVGRKVVSLGALGGLDSDSIARPDATAAPPRGPSRLPWPSCNGSMTARTA